MVSFNSQLRLILAVRIVTWNDFGESHYIGPLPKPSDVTKEIPTGSAIYDHNCPHDSWRTFLPYYIATYKGLPFDITYDQMQYWYHTSYVAGGSNCGVVGNNPSYQPELNPNVVVEDGIFFSALLTAEADITVQIGDGPIYTYSGVAGHNHWSKPFDGQTGVPEFCVVRNCITVQCSADTPEITMNTTLSDGCTNYNAWVGSWQSDWVWGRGQKHHAHGPSPPHVSKTQNGD